MLYSHTLNEIRNSNNSGIEYEIALFYCLTPNPEERKMIFRAIHQRDDTSKIVSIIERTATEEIFELLSERNLTFIDCFFETQNDAVGPADIVMHVTDPQGNTLEIGLSVKYSNNCTLNVTGRRFITEKQIERLKQEQVTYTELYVDEMKSKYGSVTNWFRKRKPSETTEKFIDLVRDAVIFNWPKIKDKQALLDDLYQSDSPIEYWVFKYTSKSYVIDDSPFHLSGELANQVYLEKMDTSYIAFYISGKKIGHMQVKFNNGFLENCKKKEPDIIIDGIPMSYGQPFSSWNFSIENW